MKKLLAILGSLTLMTSSSSTLIACGGMLQVRKTLAPILNYFNNSQNNLVGASLQKAKSVIIDDQFGIDQNKTLEILNGFSAQENIDNYDAQDGNLNSTSILKDVMGKYLGTNVVDGAAVMGKSVRLGGHLGVESGLESLLPSQFKPYLRQFLSWIRSGNLVNSPFWNTQDLNTTLTNVDELFKSGGEGVNLIIDQLVKLINNQFGIDITSVLTTWLPKIINAINGFMNGEKVNQLRTLLLGANDLYETALSGAINDLGTDLTFKDLNQKLFSVIVKILNQLFSLTPDANLDNLGTGLDDDEKFLTTFVNQLIKGESLTMVDLSDQTTWPALFQPVFEFIIISNIYFEKFDSLKSYQVVDHNHLFSASDDNYTYLSKLKDDKVSDSQVFKDGGLNLNYFVANLNYFLGSLQNFDQTSEYRLEQLLFLLFNDASPSQNGDPYYFDKQSSTLKHLLKIGLGLGYLNNLAPQTILAIMQTPSLEDTIFNALKPIFLGFINGDDASGLINLVNNVLPLLPNLIPDLNQFPLNQIFEILQLMVKNLAAHPEDSKNMFHFLFSGDGNKLFQGIELPESFSKVLGKLFGGGEKNFLTLLNKPLFEILSLLGVKGFDQGLINPLGDNFTLKSLPQLLGLLNNYLNHVDPNSAKNASLYVDPDNPDNPDNSLQNFNKKDIKVEVDLLQRLVGDTGENNLISQVLIKLFGLNPDGSGTLSLDVPDTLEYLGFLGNDTYEVESFLGDFMQLSLPNLVKKLDDLETDGQFQLSEDNVPDDDLYGIDLYQLFAKDLLDIFNKFTNPTDYSVLISQLLTTKNTYELVYDPKKFTYFTNTGKTLIKGFSYQVIFTNPLNNLKTTYWFKISRNSNTEVFHFDSIINDRILNS